MELTEAKKLLKKYMPEHDKFAKQASVGIDYYNNKSNTTKNGASSIDEVNAYRKSIAQSPLHVADNRIGTNWHKVIVDQKVGYLFSNPVKIDIDTGEKGIDEQDKPVNQKVSDVLSKSFEKIIKKVATDCSNTGRGWIHYWYGQEPTTGALTKFQYYFVPVKQIIPVYTGNLIPTLKYVIRAYVLTDDDNVDYNVYDVWSDTELTRFKQKKKNADLLKYNDVQGFGNSLSSEAEIFANIYGRVPFIPFSNNADGTSDIQMYKALIDNIEKSYSMLANEIEDIPQTLWMLKNYAGSVEYEEVDADGVLHKKDIDLLKILKTLKYVSVDVDGELKPIQNEINCEAEVKFIELAKKQLFISAMAVDPSPDKVGNQSGVYIKFLYSLLELKAANMESEFRESIEQLVTAILQYLNISNVNSIEQTWTRNKPEDMKEMIEAIISSANTISEETKTKKNPLVDNWQEERVKIEEEQKKHYEDKINNNMGGQR